MRVPSAFIKPFLLSTLALSLAVQPGCVFVRGQRYHHFTTKTPLSENRILILGFLGGRDRWNDSNRSVRKLALKLRAMNLPGVEVETVENKKRALALKLIHNALDCNQDGQLDKQERASARLIIYGQSFGGAAVVKLARQLKQMNVPVLLTVQIDSVGRGDRLIPSNVARAANLFQSDGWIIQGEPQIQAEDPARTAILGNFKFDYRDKQIDLSRVPWWKKSFRVAHTRMEHDPAVWAKVEEIIIEAVKGAANISPKPVQSHRRFHHGC